MSFLKYYLPAFLLAYLLISFVWPSVRVYRQTGINPVVFGKTESAHDYIGLVMKLLTGLVAVSVLSFSLSAQVYQLLVPIYYLDIIELKWIGLILMHLALGWIVIAQQQMSNSWRIGIDEQRATDLVTGGLFRYSRNPIFLGMLVSLAGLFLVLPNALSFFATLTTYFIIQIQIRLEEEFLERKHGANYITYKKKVSRLL